MLLVHPLPTPSHDRGPFFLPVDFLCYILKFQATWPGQKCLGQWGLWVGPGQHVGVCSWCSRREGRCGDGEKRGAWGRTSWAAGPWGLLEERMLARWPGSPHISALGSTQMETGAWNR